MDETTPKVPSLADKGAKKSKRFAMFCIAMGLLFVLDVLSICLKVDPALLTACTGPIVLVAAGSLGFQNWHDKNVRCAEINSGQSGQV